MSAIQSFRPVTSLQQRGPAVHRSTTPLAVICRCSAAAEAPTRRALMASAAAAAAAVLLPMLAPAPAQAFGSGIPGYDINMGGRRRALERNKREMQAELDRAAAYRAKLAADKAAKATAPAPPLATDK